MTKMRSFLRDDLAAVLAMTFVLMLLADAPVFWSGFSLVLFCVVVGIQSIPDYRADRARTLQRLLLWIFLLGLILSSLALHSAVASLLWLVIWLMVYVIMVSRRREARKQLDGNASK